MDPSDGNDGPWSTFAFRVGEPEQVVKLLVGTTSSETWVVDESGCNDLTTTCPNDRGYLFNQSKSMTWRQNNVYSIPYENNLGIDVTGQYGFDTVGLDWPGSGGPSINQSVIAGIAAPDFFLGVFGLSPRPVNFSSSESASFDDPQSSYLSQLQKSNAIPSLSYGYTAGAKNRQCLSKRVLGSLTLGGYDASLFQPSNVSFNMSQVTDRDLMVGVQSIQIQTAGEPDHEYHDGFYSFVDGIASHIWLPLAACEMFEEAFGIEYDPLTELYLVNDTLHRQLLSHNATIDFELAMIVNEGPTITIQLPYSSFDLLATAEYPGVKNESHYFPIRRATNESQFTLGRTFLQDAYLIVDYERSSFSLNQRTFDTDAPQKLVPLEPLTGAGTNATEPLAYDGNDEKQGTLRPGYIAGIVVGAVIVLLFIVGTWFLIRRKTRKWNKHQSKETEQETEQTVSWQKAEMEEQLRYELEEERLEMDGHLRYELEEQKPGMGRRMRYELEEPRPEMDGREFVCAELHADHRATELPSHVRKPEPGPHPLYELE
ncbi:acid protease [Viridothelium virens]|uniref:Acid protease n=1 Tax=Viridothelium virens TaxID=1048519 RepID=A0A6A6HCQ6_VIRVR|nr:acid protease [Viridothelium virens]